MSDDDATSPREAARRLLDRARRSAPSPRRAARRPRPEDQPWSGPGPDERDPAPLGASLDELVRDREWSATLRSAGILASWERIVGPDVAAHCRPVRLHAGELTCVAESTAWATQIRLLASGLVQRIATEVGPDVVTRVRVQGPTAPDWRHGPLRVTGRGPRDTYG